MVTTIEALLGLPVSSVLLLAAIIFVAGIVRGFTGFALSAFVMSTAVALLPPLELIPILFWLELGASLLMIRSGWRDADRMTAGLLIIGATVGTFVGLGVTVSIDPSHSRVLALCLLIALVVLQLIKVRIPGLTTTAGTLLSGVASGIANGLASVGGMVVALYVLARADPPQRMRATLVVYLIGGVVTSFASLVWWGAMTSQAALRGLGFLPIGMLGVLVGMTWFTPRWQRYYRQACLWLLFVLSAVALFRAVT